MNHKIMSSMLVRKTKLSDKLDKMFELRKAYMSALQEKHPNQLLVQPIDLANKKTQQQLRDLALRGVEEIFEALQHFKNSKAHRVTENTEFDQDAFTEEMVDAFNYFLSLLILVDVTPDKLFEKYVYKDNVIHNRIKSNY